MTYADIMDRIYTNVGSKGIAHREPTLVETTKKDIYDSISKIYRKSQPIKDNIINTIYADDTAITSGLLTIGRIYKINTFVTGDNFMNAGAILNATGEEFLATATTPTVWTNGSELQPIPNKLYLPSNFFIPLEVIFKNSDGIPFARTELQYEEYLRWNTESESVSSSFNDLISSPVTPLLIPITKENQDYDGLIGYTFTDSNPQTLIWKPAISGTVQIGYSTFFDTVITDANLSSSPDIHKSFSELIVLEVTIKQLIRKISETTDQVKLIALQSSVGHYKNERTELLKDFIGYVNTNTSTPVIEPFSFQQDLDRILFYGN
jgi:hypothetical protein